MHLNINGKILDNIKLIIFDKDGTITDLYKYWSWIARKRASIICKKLDLEKRHINEIQEKMGLDIKRKRFKPEGPIGVKKRSEVLDIVVDYLMSQSISNPRAICEEAFNETDILVNKNLKSLIKLIPGVPEFFERIDNKCKIAIATSDNTKRASIIMNYLNIKNIDLIVGGDQVSKSKPDPEVINKILSKLGINANRAIIIGDSCQDTNCGKNANLMAGIAVCTGLDDRSDLIKSTDYVVDSLSEIKVD